MRFKYEQEVAGVQGFHWAWNNGRTGEVRVGSGPVSWGKGMSQGEPGTVLAKNNKLARLAGIPLKIVALWVCNYCPKLPRLDWNVVVIQKSRCLQTNGACLLLLYWKTEMLPSQICCA